MRLSRWLLPLCLVLAPAVSAQEEDPEDTLAAVSISKPTETPLFKNRLWFLPREVLVDAIVGNRFVVPQLRLKWELNMYHLQNDSLYIAVEGAGGYGVGLPTTVDTDGNPPMDLFYEDSMLVGAGYRMDRRSGLHFSVEALSGLTFYGGHYGPFKDGNSVGTFEGRAKFGWRAGRVVYGAFAAESAPFQRVPRSFSTGYVGGLMFGLFANWH